MTKWEITYRYYDVYELIELLNEGWEPFAVTVSGEQGFIEKPAVWLRRPRRVSDDKI